MPKPHNPEMITADSETLMRQASMTASEYLDEAVKRIDQTLGKGYAKAHPELIGAFMQAAALDMGSAIIAKTLQDGMSGISMWLKYLGNGDAATPMGAIEAFGKHIGDKLDILADAVRREID